MLTSILSVKSTITILVICCLYNLCLKPAKAADQNQAGINLAKKDNFRAKFGKGLSFTSEDKNFKASLNGSLQVDAAFHNSDVTPLEDGYRIRRGRVGIGTRIYRDWNLRAEYDFTGRELEFRGFQDLYLRYTGIRRSAFSVGNLKEPIGLEWQTSSKNTTFMERALLTALLPPYNLGFTASTHGNSWSLSGGVFGERLVNGISTNNGWGATGRVTVSPYHKKNLSLHFGLSGSYRERGLDSSNLRLRSFPEANVEDVRFVNTGSIRRVTDRKLMGLEFAAVNGPFSFQTEYLRTFINRNRNRDDLEFDGWYAYGSWFMTGESRNYIPKSGKFGRIKPEHNFDLNGGFGAFEVAARYSEIDLNDQRIAGGRENNITLGLNWYWNSSVRLMANYIFIQTDNNALGRRNGGSEQPEIFELRAQIEF